MEDEQPNQLQIEKALKAYDKVKEVGDFFFLNGMRRFTAVQKSLI